MANKIVIRVPFNSRTVDVSCSEDCTKDTIAEMLKKADALEKSMAGAHVQTAEIGDAPKTE
jgi:hypothetical protein